MARIDLFTSRHCSACPEARRVVMAFAQGRPDVEVVEWDFDRGRGPAAGRGIFVTPSMLINDREIVFGIPTLEQLERLMPLDGGQAASSVSHCP